MVIPAMNQEPRRRSAAEMAEKRPISPHSRRSIPQSRLHNFSFPPTLTWGNQKLLRCVNLSNRSMDDDPPQTVRRCSSSSSPTDPPPPPPPPPRSTEHKQDLEEAEAKESNPSRRWNLRSRRAARNVQSEIFWNRNHSPPSSQSRSSSCSPQEEKMGNPVILVTRFDSGEKGERRKFSIALSKEEIEADFLAAKGAKPPRRPKKRAKYLQRQIDFLFPGLFLSEVTSDLYKTEEIGN